MYYGLPVTAYYVLCSGNFLGGFVKGITGFGSVVMLFFLWAVCTLSCIPSGPLRLVVLTETVAGFIGAIPLIIMTRAWTTADWRILAGALPFAFASSYLGAYLLAVLDSKVVAIIAGSIILSVVVCHWTTKVCASDFGKKKRKDLALKWQAGRGKHSDASAAPTPAPPTFEDAGDAKRKTVIKVPEQEDDIQDTAFEAQYDVSGPPVLAQLPSLQMNRAADVENLSLKATDEVEPQKYCIDFNFKRVAKRFKNPEYRRQSKTIMIWAAGAGTVAGVLGAMTGLSGPPVMYMYMYLNLPKSVVRGTNAWSNVLQVRVIMYAILGQWKKNEIPLYFMCAGFSLVGIFLGCLLSPHINQRMFHMILTFLMMVAGILLIITGSPSAPCTK